MDLIAIMLPDREEPCFCSILGRGGECFGVNTFVGYSGLRDFLSIAQCEKNGMPVEYVMLEQSNLSCYFGSRDSVPNKQKQIIRKLGFKFRGPNQWLYFESYKKGYIPYILDMDETVFLTACLEQLVLAVQAYINQGIKVNFEEGEMLLRRYDKKSKQWIDESAPLPFIHYEYPLVEIQDELLKIKLKKQQRISVSLELDMTYLNSCITDKKYERPINPKLILLMDHASDAIVAQKMLTPENDETREILNLFISFVMEYGKPREINIRNPFIRSVLESTCKYCGIPLIMRRQLKAVDFFVDEFKRFNY